MNDPAMKLAEEAIRIGATLLAQHDALQAEVAELKRSVLWWSSEANKTQKQHHEATVERDEYRNALADATAKYDAAMKVVAK